RRTRLHVMDKDVVSPVRVVGRQAADVAQEGDEPPVGADRRARGRVAVVDAGGGGADQGGGPGLQVAHEHVLDRAVGVVGHQVAGVGEGGDVARVGARGGAGGGVVGGGGGGGGAEQGGRPGLQAPRQDVARAVGVVDHHA